jgi:hypothetical protein
MRDWYALGQLTLLPLAATLVLHLRCCWRFLVLRWQPSASDPRVIEARVLPPAVIKATLIDAASLKPQAESGKARPAPRKKPRRRPGAGQRRQPAAHRHEPRPNRPQRKSRAATHQNRAGAARAEKPRISAEELAAISRRELASAVAEEETRRWPSPPRRWPRATRP